MSAKFSEFVIIMFKQLFICYIIRMTVPLMKFVKMIIQDKKLEQYLIFCKLLFAFWIL